MANPSGRSSDTEGLTPDLPEAGDLVAQALVDPGSLPGNRQAPAMTPEGASASEPWTQPATWRQRVQAPPSLDPSDVLQQLQDAVDLAALGWCEADWLEGSVYWSPRFSSMLGRTGQTVPLAPEDFLREIVHPDDRARVRSSFRTLVETGARFDETYRVVTPEGDIRHLHGVARARRDPGGNVRGFFGVSHDVTDSISAEREIRYLATHDPVTGALSRPAFEEYLDALGRQEGWGAEAAPEAPRGDRPWAQPPFDDREPVREGAVLVLDFEDFRHVNHTWGYGAGDAVLRESVRRLQAEVGPRGEVGRIGADEFGVACPLAAGRQTAAWAPRAPDDGAHHPVDPVERAEVALAERLCAALAAPFRVCDQAVVLTPRAGVVRAPAHGARGSELVSHSLLALDVARRAGGWYVFTRELLDQPRETATGIQSLRNGVREHAFVVHYQPQVRLRDGRVCGAEALVRWAHPERGLLGPAAFLPLAERTGIVADIGRQVLEASVAEARRWTEAGYDLRLGVNLSAVQFDREDVLSHVLGVVADQGVKPGHLELELTESTLASDMQAAVASVADLRAHGVHVALDDFGTGYCSLSALHRFGVDRLKLDRSFVTPLPGDAEASTIARSVLALGASLGLGTLAEGVETLEQLEWLRRHGCDEIQGYYVSPALSAEDFLAFLHRTRGLWRPPSAEAGSDAGVRAAA